MSRHATGSLVDHLLTAASRGKDQEVRRLLNQGAPFGRDWLGRSPLHLAAAGGHIDVIKTLIAGGCEVNIRDQVSCTPLHRASVGEFSVAAVKALLAGGAKLDLQDEHGSTALHEAAWSGNYRVIRILLKARCNINIRNQAGFTALQLAAQNGHVRALQILIDGCADLQAQNDYGDTALHIATRYGHLDIARRLINAGSNLNIMNKDGYAPIHLAAQVGKLHIAEALIDGGCNVLARNNASQTAAILAKQYRNKECWQLLTRAMQACQEDGQPNQTSVPPSAAVLDYTDYGYPVHSRQRHRSDDSETRDFSKTGRIKSRHHRASSADRENREFAREKFSPDEAGVLKLNYPLLPYYMNGATSDSEDSLLLYRQEVAQRGHTRTVSERTASERTMSERREIRQAEIYSEEDFDSTTSVSSTGADSIGSDKKRSMSMIIQPNRHQSSPSNRRQSPAQRRQSPVNRRQSPATADIQSVQSPVIRKADERRTNSYRQPPPYNQALQQRRGQTQVQTSPTSNGSEMPQKIRVHHPFMGRNKNHDPFKKPPNLFFVSFEEPEPVEDACRLSDIGGRPYIPPRAAVYIAQKSAGKQDHGPQSGRSGAEVKRQLEDVKENEPNIPESEDPANDKIPSSPKAGCLKQKSIVMPPALPQQKRVAFDIPPSSGTPSEVGETAEGSDLSDEKRRLGDGAQSGEHIAEEPCEDPTEDMDCLQPLDNGKLSGMDDHVVPKLRMRHSSLPDPQQCLAHKSGRFSSLKALKRFVMSRHSKSALKKKVNESAVISLEPNKVVIGGSAVQSSTTLQRSNSFRGQKSSLSSSSDSTADVPVQRGGRHSSEVLTSRPSLGSFIRGLPEKIRGRAVGSEGYSTSFDSSTKDTVSPVHLGASQSSLASSSDSNESKQQQMMLSEEPDVDRRRESLVSGEDGAESVESPGEADKICQEEQEQLNGIVNNSHFPEQGVGLKTSVDLASLEQRYQHKLQAVERECEARATAKEVHLHAKIRELEEQIVSRKW